MTSHLPTLRRLDQWLGLERWAPALSLGGFWLPLGPLMIAMAVFAVAFVPVLIHGLWTAEKRGWLVAFGLTMAVAGLVVWALPDMWSGLEFGIGGIAFFGYTWALSLAVREWISEAEEALQWKLQSARPTDDDLAWSA